MQPSLGSALGRPIPLRCEAPARPTALVGGAGPRRHGRALPARRLGSSPPCRLPATLARAASCPIGSPTHAESMLHMGGLVGGRGSFRQGGEQQVAPHSFFLHSSLTAPPMPGPAGVRERASGQGQPGAGGVRRRIRQRRARCSRPRRALCPAARPAAAQEGRAGHPRTCERQLCEPQRRHHGERHHAAAHRHLDALGDVVADHCGRERGGRKGG